MSSNLSARALVEGFGGRSARKSPYAGPSWSFTSSSWSAVGRCRVQRGGGGSTIDRLALCQVAVLLTCQQRVSVAAHNTLNVTGGDVEKETFRHGCAAQGGNVLLSLNRRLLVESSLTSACHSPSPDLTDTSSWQRDAVWQLFFYSP